MANFNPAGSGSLVFATGGSLGNRTLVNPVDHGLRPPHRHLLLGDPKTVVRAGYGVYYTLLERIGSENQLALNPPFLVNKTPSSNTVPVLQPEVGFPANFLDPSTINLNALQEFHIRSVDPAEKRTDGAAVEPGRPAGLRLAGGLARWIMSAPSPPTIT